MGNIFGAAIHLSIYGESHGKAIGMTLDGLPAGEPLDLEEIGREMRRRAPGGTLSTARREPDQPEILSGMWEGKTTGSPLSMIIYNRDARSQDYDGALRPGHADLTALLKHGGHSDMRGGGHFSGRLTAALTFGGAIAKQILRRRGIDVYGRICSIGTVADGDSPENPHQWATLAQKEFPVWNADAAKEMQEEILTVRQDRDSVGGVAEAIAFGVPAGLGEPFFRSVESHIAAMLFSIPAVKGVEFGDGFALSQSRASETNDPIIVNDGGLKTATNHCGGILGGISTGMPILVRAAFKPTPSIGKPQRSVNPGTGQPAEITVSGRHDPCIVPRAVPVVEAGIALCLLDFLLEREGKKP